MRFREIEKIVLNDGWGVGRCERFTSPIQTPNQNGKSYNPKSSRRHSSKGCQLHTQTGGSQMRHPLKKGALSSCCFLSGGSQMDDGRYSVIFPPTSMI